MSLRKKEHILFLILSIIVLLWSKDYGFFWDNITFGYDMGMHLFEHGLFNFNFPNSFDPGHPPFLAVLLASVWKIFGRSLFISHLVLLPFIYGFLIQLWTFIKHYISSKHYRIIILLIVLLDPTLDAQFLLISPEVIHLFFFFLAVNGILKNNKLIKVMGLLFLGIVSYRGMMLFAGIFLFDLIRHLWLEHKLFVNFITNKLILYVISALPAFSFVAYRLLTKGWLQTHPDSPWAALWHFADFNHFIKNIIVLIKHYLDFGRITVFLLLFYLLIKHTAKFNSTKTKELLLLAVTSVLFIIITCLVAVNTFGHRYFLVSYLVLILLACKMVYLLYSKKQMYLIYVLFAISLIGGNFWIYPRDISQGWDASLAHTSYFSLRKQAIQYLDTKNIPIEKTTTFFPAGGSIDKIDLSGDFRSFEHKFTGKEEYVLYSTVFNLSDENLKLLKDNYNIIESFSSSLVCVEILKHK